MINLAPWYYRKLLGSNSIIEIPNYYKITLLDKSTQFEAVVSLNKILKPEWVSSSNIYKNCDGSGTDKFKNVAVYKAISEALERLAFYELAEVAEKEYLFDLNPTTTGMAAFPYFNCKFARINARNEAIERWAIHEFNRNKLPLINHSSTIRGLGHYEIVTPFSSSKVSLLFYKFTNFYVYGFAGGNTLSHSFERALIELDRNIRVLNKFYSQNENILNNINDKRILFFSTSDGFQCFNDKVKSSPKVIKSIYPKKICDKELKGHWNEYTKVWRYLLDNSYCDNFIDESFFMF